MVNPDHPLLGNGHEDTYNHADEESFPASDTPNPDIPVARGGVNEAEGKVGGAVSTGESHTADDTESFPASDTPAGVSGASNEGGGDPTSGGEPENGKPEAEPTGAITVTAPIPPILP
jgi:hypothetical protein